MNPFFVLLFFYGLAHLFFWWRLRSVLALSRPLSLGAGILVAFFMLSLFIGGWFLTVGLFMAGELLSNIGFYWLSFFFVLFCMDTVLRLLARIQGMIGGMNHSASWGDARKTVLVAVAVAVFTNLYGVYEAKQIGVTRLDLINPDMKSPMDAIRIVQVSDVHYGLTMQPDRHQRLMELLRTLNPDIIVSTGDFLDRGAEHVGDYMDAWQALKPRLGKYAVTGNHEAIAGLPRSLALLERAGFHVLRGERVNFGDFQLVGLDDPLTDQSENLHFSPDDLIGQAGISILLNHRPGWPSQLDARFDLVLSGHTHGGQIFPFGLLIYLVHGHLSGLSSTPWGGWNYISRGVGTWGPPVRILAPPEVVLLVMGSGKEKGLTYTDNIGNNDKSY